MTARRSPLLWTLDLLALALFELAGCAPARQAAYRTPLLPAAVEAPAASAVALNPPAVEPSPYGREIPEFLRGPALSLPGPSAAGSALQRAEARFQAGKRFFQAGDTEAARREFDEAIDTLLSAPAVAPGRQELERKLSELVEAIHQYDVSGLGAGEPDSGPVYDKSPIEDIPEPTFPIDPKLRNQVAEELKAAVSQLPLAINDEVLRYINYFSTTRGRKILVSGLRRAGRYRPLILRILDEEGVPRELRHLAQAESGFSPRAVSRKRATGMWQFILSRGQQYGLEKTKTTDDRLDPEKATRAAARHLRDLYNEFGDWYLAMAAYNCGPVTIEKAVERTGYADFWELRRRNVLPVETGNYVPVILAMAIMAKNPAHYGLEAVDPEPPLEYSTTELDAAVHLDLIADITRRPVSEIREMNPALLTKVAPGGYALHVPAGTEAAVVSALELVPPARRTAWRLHRVANGDTLTGIAQLYRATPQQIAAVNSSIADGLEPGDLLIVPVSPQPVKRVVRAKASSRPAVKAASKKQPAKTSSTALVASKRAPGRQFSTAR